MNQQHCENSQNSEGKTAPRFCSLVIARQRDHHALALTAACRDLKTDISQPLVNTLLSHGSICSPSLPFSSNYETQNSSPKLLLVVNIFHAPGPAWVQTQSLLLRQRTEAFWKQEGTSVYQSVSSLTSVLSVTNRCSLKMRRTRVCDDTTQTGEGSYGCYW